MWFKKIKTDDELQAELQALCNTITAFNSYSLLNEIKIRRIA